jgi:hypothetical protein
MKVYLIKDDDLDNLLANLDRNPEHGYEGGSSAVFNEVEKLAFDQTHRFCNCQVRTWIDKEA